MQLQGQFSGKTITIDTSNAIASGGEGRIYTVLQDPSLVAKIYHKPTEEDAEKLTVMFSMPPDAPIAAPGHASIAWPIDLLRTVGSPTKIIGFLMPRVSKVLPVHIYYTPKTRREQKPLFNYLYLHRTARNLAAAVNALHIRGYVIGDVNESNILVTDTALVTLVDTDSFQVRDPYTGYVFRCPVGKPEFTPPELQGQTFRDIDRTPENDLFGLGVLIFQLVMEGTHPFSGVYQGSGEPPSLEARIKAGHYPYSHRRVPYRPMPVAPSLDILHPTLRQMFVRCFEDGYDNPVARPDAKSWVNALKEAEDALIACAKNNQHKYGNHLSACPWCDRAKLLKGRDPFPSRQVVRTGHHLQPVKQKRKRQLPPPPTIAPPPRPQGPSGRLIQPMGQYQPPLIPMMGMSPRTAAPPPMPVGGVQGFLQDALWGTVWGGLCAAALAGLILAVDGGGAVLGAIFVGMIWGAFFGMIWGVFSLPPNQTLQKWVGILIGSLWGGFFLAAIGGAVFGAISSQAIVGESIGIGTVAGTLWGSVWHTFKPPMALPLGRMWGTRGAFVGAIWGSCLGTLAGGGLGGVSILSRELSSQPSLSSEFVPLLIGVVLVSAGLGSLGGIPSGAILGAFGAAPKLPVSFQPSGVNGAMLGAIWGTFLGAVAGALMGGLLSALFPELTGSSTVRSLEFAPFIASVVVVAGVGSLWGLVSGAIWGALGKW